MLSERKKKGRNWGKGGRADKEYLFTIMEGGGGRGGGRGGEGGGSGGRGVYQEETRPWKERERERGGSNAQVSAIFVSFFSHGKLVCVCSR